MSHASVIIALDETTDVERAVEDQMAPFYEDGDWFREGSRWDWYVVGGRWDGFFLGQNTVRKGEIDLAALRAVKEARLRNTFRKYADDNHRHLIADIQPDETEDEYVKRKLGRSPFTAYAFLRNRVWQEKARMGWFGGRAATECETRGAETHVCVYKGEEAKIVSWHDPKDWADSYYERFIEPLPDEAMLVIVDYHV